jgi:hypothetical protein
MKKTVLIIGAVLTMAACSERPEDIAAADIGQGAYAPLNCQQLADRRFSFQQELDELSQSQRRARTGDTVGVVLLGLPLSRMSGNDRETQIAVTRGHLREIDRERQAKRCT